MITVNGKNVQQRMATNALLRHEEWQEIDAAVLEAARLELGAVQDLLDAGLTHSLGGLGTIITAYERQSEMTPASVTLDASTRVPEDGVAYDLIQVPVPVISKEFRLDIRMLSASRNMGDALDTTQIRESGRRVAEMAEMMLFRGNEDVTRGEAKIYGYTNHPSVNVASKSSWADIDINDPKDDILTWIGIARAERFRGPFMLYVDNVSWLQLQQTYDDGSGNTAWQRIMAIPEIKDVKSNDFLEVEGSGETVLVQMTSNVVDLATAQDLTTVQWDERGGLTELYKVMLVQVPRVKADFNGRCGIVHAVAGS